MLCELVTQPNYVVINVYAAILLTYGLGYGSLVSIIGSNFFVWAALGFVMHAVCMSVLWFYPTGKWAQGYNMHYNGADKAK